MILIVVLRAMLWRVPRAVERRPRPLRPRARSLPFGVHLWGFLLPPWPNYGVPRVKAVARARQRR